MIAGAALRMKGLTFNSYWVDEIYSLSFSNPSNSLEKVFEETTIIDVHPPLYQTTLWVWFKLFGYTEFAGRLLSVVIGTTGVLAIYFLAKELFDKYVGLCASLIASTNYFLIYYSQEARSYSLILLLTVVSYLFLKRTLENPQKKNILPYWITTVLLLYTNYITMFVVGTQVFVFFFYIYKFPANRKKLAALALLTAFIFILSILPILKYIPFNREGLLYWVEKPSPFFFLGYIYWYFGNIVLFLLFAASGLISTIYLFDKKSAVKEKTALALLLVWIISGYLIPYFKSIMSTPILVPRYTIYIVPAIIIFVSYGLWRINSRTRGVLLGIIIIFSMYQLLHNYYHSITKAQWRGVLQNVISFNPLPAYEYVPYDGWGKHLNLYQTYAKMLQMDIIIQSTTKLEEDFDGGTLPECFWVLDARRDHIKESKILNNTPLNQAYKTNLADAMDETTAVGILYAYKTDPAKCLKKAGIDKSDND
jgi:uncharacterized membrane protein